MEDEISTVTNSHSKLGDQMIEIRQDMTDISGSLRTELAEMKHILWGMSNNKTPSPRRKTHRQGKIKWSGIVVIQQRNYGSG
jgi:hypothetical protein